MYVVILAGGGGTRLWPVSRPSGPSRSCRSSATSRCSSGPSGGSLPLVGEDDIFCVTDRRYGQLVRDQVPDVGLIVEPNGRNTAAAIALATAVIDRPEDEVMLVLPADHRIEHEDAFRDVIGVAGDRPGDGCLRASRSHS